MKVGGFEIRVGYSSIRAGVSIVTAGSVKAAAFWATMRYATPQAALPCYTVILYARRTYRMLMENPEETTLLNCIAWHCIVLHYCVECQVVSV